MDIGNGTIACVEWVDFTSIPLTKSVCAELLPHLLSLRFQLQRPIARPARCHCLNAKQDSAAEGCARSANRPRDK